MDMRKVRLDLHNHLLQPGKTVLPYRAFDIAMDIAEAKLGKGGIFGIANFYGSLRYEMFENAATRYEKVIFDRGIYVPEKDTLIVRIQEVIGDDWHVLAIGLPKPLVIKDHLPFSEVSKIAKENHAFLEADHAFAPDGLGLSKLEQKIWLPEVSAGEVYNSRTALFPGANRKARRFFEEKRKKHPNLGLVVGSDGGSVYNIGRCSSEIEMPASYTDTEPKNSLITIYLKAGIEKCDGSNAITSPARLEAFLHILHSIKYRGTGYMFKRLLGKG